jgi:protein SCO1/2
MSAAAGIKKTVIIICVFMLAMIGLLVNKQLSKPLLNTEQLRDQGVFLYDKPRIIKPFSLIDHHGQVFDNERLKGKWSLVFFGFTFCADVCPTTMSMLKTMYAGIEDKSMQASTQVLLVSVDPARDTKEQLAQYVPYFNPDFLGVTGEFMSVYGFATNLSAPFQKVPGGGENYVVDHSGYIFLINPRGDYQGFFKPPFDADNFRQHYYSVRDIYHDLQ